MKEGFEKCPREHSLFIKTKEGGKVLIVCLYVDDLIFTENDEHMITFFKKSMMLEFDMSDLGRMRYFLGIEVLQDKRVFSFIKGSMHMKCCRGSVWIIFSVNSPKMVQSRCFIAAHKTKLTKPLKLDMFIKLRSLMGSTQSQG